MARARNIKPGFFENEFLAELPIAARLLFIGLWTLADREGRLEDRPKRIRMKLVPFDDVDVDALLQSLSDAGFLERYGACTWPAPDKHQSQYIQILNFKKHQSPHVKEKASTIPAPGKHRASTGQAEKGKVSTPPDSLNPDSLNPEKKPIEPSAGANGSTYPPKFEECWKAYPKRSGGNPKKTAFKAWNARLKQGATEDEMAEGVARYAKFCKATGKLDTEFVKQAATFFGPDEHFRETWEASSGNGAERGESEFSRLCEGAL